MPSTTGFAVVDTYYDAAVSGADPIETRPGFLALLDRIEGDGVRTVLIEDASRFARKLVAEKGFGILSLIKRGVRVLTAAGDDLHRDRRPLQEGHAPDCRRLRCRARRRGWWPSSAMRATASAASGASVRVARRALSVQERENNPQLVKALTAAMEMAKRLRRASPKTGERRSLRTISAELAAAGYLNERGQPFNPNSVDLMLEG